MSARLLTPTGWTPLTSGYPSGREWIDNYLVPLANALGGRVRYRRRVTGMSRQGHDRVLSPGREQGPFVIHLRDADGVESRLCARAVIDPSGTWGNPIPLVRMGSRPCVNVPQLRRVW